MVDLEGCENQVDLQDLHHSLEKNTTQQMMKENEKSMDLKIVRIKVEEVTVISKCKIFLLILNLVSSSFDTEMHLKCLYFELIDKSKEEKGKSSKKKGDRDSKKRKVSLCYIS